MSQAFTHYWNHATFEEMACQNGQPLGHVAGNVFAQRGVEPGDRVYVVTIRNGGLHLLGRMEVGRLVDYHRAAASLDYEPLDRSEHLLARTCTAMRIDRRVPDVLAPHLQFVGTRGLVAPKRKTDGSIDEQSLRGFRRLSRTSAAMLDVLLAEETIHTPDWSDRCASGDQGREANAVLEPLIDYCDEQGYIYQLDDEGDLTSRFGDEPRFYGVLAMAVASHIVVYVHMPVRVEEDRRALVAETVAHANAATCLTTFVMYYNEGLISCRGSIFNDCGLLEPEAAGAAFEDVLYRARVYTELFQGVALGEWTPAEAVEAAEARYLKGAGGVGDGDESDDEAPGRAVAALRLGTLIEPEGGWPKLR